MGYEEDWGRSLLDVTSGATPAYQKPDTMIGSRDVDRKAVGGSVQGFKLLGDNVRPVDLMDKAPWFKDFATDWEMRCSLLTGTSGLRYMRPIVNAVGVNPYVFPVIGHYGQVPAEMVVGMKEFVDGVLARRAGSWPDPPDLLDQMLGKGSPAYVRDTLGPADQGTVPLENGRVFYVNVITNPVGRILKRVGMKMRDDSIEDGNAELIFGVASLVAKAGARIAGKIIKSMINRALQAAELEAAASELVAAQELEDLAVARARWLRGEARVIKGGLDQSVKTALDSARETMPRVMNRVVNGSTKTLRATSIREFHQTMTEEGFSLFKVDKFGPDGGYQMFYRRGNVVARFKTKGNAFNVRVGEPHISFSLTDGYALHWENDLAKINMAGKMRPKNIVPDLAQERSIGTQNIGMRPYWYVEDSEITKQGLDVWGSATHFPAPKDFNWTGLQDVMGALAPK